MGNLEKVHFMNNQDKMKKKTAAQVLLNIKKMDYAGYR